jgi:KDO2-lipid IV(A) lauroyltransferase
MNPMKKATHHVWVGFKYWLYRGTGLLAAKLPVRFGYFVGNLIGDFIYFTWKRHAANAVSNMRRVLGKDASWQLVKETARDSFRNYAKTLVDFLRFPYQSAEDIHKIISTPDGMENLEAGFKRGKGIIAITAHFGNWDLAGATLAVQGMPLNAVADTFQPQKMDDLINGTRKRQGMNIIKMETNSLKEIFMALRRNEIVFLLFDRPDPNEGVPVQFFGETAYIPGGPAALALKTRATVIIGYGVRKPGNKTFRAVAEPPVEYEHLLTGDKERDIQIITQEIVRRMEMVIRRNPDQWYMFREMWPRTARHNAEVRKRRFWGGGDDVRVGSW